MLVRLEMDGKRMNSLAFDGLYPSVMAFRLCVSFVAEIAAGLLYFRSIWWSASRLARRGRASVTAVLIVGRFALLGAVLIFASLQGAPPLLAMALGVLVARPLIMRKLHGTPR